MSSFTLWKKAKELKVGQSIKVCEHQVNTISQRYMYLIVSYS